MCEHEFDAYHWNVNREGPAGNLFITVYCTKCDEEGSLGLDIEEMSDNITWGDQD